MRALKSILYILIIIILTSCQNDPIIKEIPFPEWKEISFEGKISERDGNKTGTKKSGYFTTDSIGIMCNSGHSFILEPRERTSSITYYAKHIIINTSGLCEYISDLYTVTPVNNSFYIKANIPGGKSGKIYLILSPNQEDIDLINLIKSEDSLFKLWCSYNSLMETDNIPLSGSCVYKDDAEKLSINVSHTGSKLSFKYSIKSYANFKLKTISLGNILSRNYFINGAQHKYSNGTESKSYTIQSDQPEGSYTFFIPENIRESNNTIIDSEDKTELNAPAYATYIELRGICTKTNQEARIKIYPGANATSDFTLKRNGYYFMNLDIYSLDIEDPRVTIGDEKPKLIFDILNLKESIKAFSYHNCPGYTRINSKRLYVEEKKNRIGSSISGIKVNNIDITGKITIKPGTNYYTIDCKYKGLGGGTEDDPYLIYTKSQFENIKDNLAGHYKQIEDIIYQGFHTPFGSEDKPFTGTYDGNKKTLSQVSILNRVDAGIFAFADKATLKNINAAIYFALNINKLNTIGAITAHANNCRIENCSVSGPLDVANSCQVVGGIVGSVKNSEIINNKFTGYLRINTSIINYLGGIIGYAENSTITGNDFTKAQSFSFQKPTIAGAIVGGSKSNLLLNNLFDLKYQETGAFIP